VRATPLEEDTDMTGTGVDVVISFEVLHEDVVLVVGRGLGDRGVVIGLTVGVVGPKVVSGKIEVRIIILLVVLPS
jgi:hypothetical protein